MLRQYQCAGCGELGWQKLAVVRRNISNFWLIPPLGTADDKPRDAFFASAVVGAAVVAIGRARWAAQVGRVRFVAGRTDALGMRCFSVERRSCPKRSGRVSPSSSPIEVWRTNQGIVNTRLVIQSAFDTYAGEVENRTLLILGRLS